MAGSLIQNKAKLSQLAPWLRGYVWDVATALEEIGLHATVYEVYRSSAAQDERFRAGETNAKGGQSPHQYGLAFDMVVPEGENSPEQLQLQAFWKALGFAVLTQPVGKPPRYDRSHVEMPNWKGFIGG